MIGEVDDDADDADVMDAALDANVYLAAFRQVRRFVQRLNSHANHVRPMIDVAALATSLARAAVTLIDPKKERRDYLALTRVSREAADAIERRRAEEEKAKRRVLRYQSIERRQDALARGEKRVKRRRIGPLPLLRPVRRSA